LKGKTTPDDWFFEVVHFGRSDEELFTFGRDGFIHRGLDKDLALMLQRRENYERKRLTSKQLPIALVESLTRESMLPIALALGPAHQYFCKFAGSPEVAFYRINSGSHLGERVHENPTDIDMLSFGNRPDSYVALTKTKIIYNRVPQELALLLEQGLDVRHVQLWKDDGWFASDSFGKIYYNNISDPTLLNLFEQHAQNHVEVFSASLNGENWYLRTKSGLLYYKSQRLRDIQKQRDSRFHCDASLLPEQG